MINKILFVFFIFLVLPFVVLAGDNSADTNKTKKEITIESKDLDMFGVSLTPKRADKFIDIVFDPELFRGDINIEIFDKKDKSVFVKDYREKEIKNSEIHINVEEFKKGLYKVVITTLEVSLELYFAKK